jgi:hypothetical protein
LLVNLDVKTVTVLSISQEIELGGAVIYGESIHTTSASTISNKVLTLIYVVFGLIIGIYESFSVISGMLVHIDITKISMLNLPQKDKEDPTADLGKEISIGVMKINIGLWRKYVDLLIENLIFWFKRRGWSDVFKLIWIWYLFALMSTGIDYISQVSEISCLFKECQLDLEDLFLQKVGDENLNKFYAVMIAIHRNTRKMEQDFTLCCVGFYLWYIMPSIWYTKIFRDFRVSV